MNTTDWAKSNHDRNRCSGFYRGKVIQRSSNKHGLLKIWIPGVYPEEWEDQPSMLPDAEPASPLFAGCNNGNGMFSYPNIGSTVWCFFQNEDQNFPVYFAATYGGPEAAGQFATCEAIPTSEDGAYIHKICCGKTTILLTETGNLRLETRAVDSSNNPKTVEIQMDQSGNLRIHGSTSIDIDAKDIRIVATSRLEMKSPVIEVTTNYAGKGANDNCLAINSDSFLVDVGDGTAMVIDRHNGPHIL